MNTKPWHFNGVARFGSCISETTRELLENILINKAKESTAKAFIEDVDTAVASYRGTRA